VHRSRGQLKAGADTGVSRGLALRLGVRLSRGMHRGIETPERQHRAIA
jgi:hypothetical protein